MLGIHAIRYHPGINLIEEIEKELK